MICKSCNKCHYVFCMTLRSSFNCTEPNINNKFVDIHPVSVPLTNFMKTLNTNFYPKSQCSYPALLTYTIQVRDHIWVHAMKIIYMTKYWLLPEKSVLISNITDITSPCQHYCFNKPDEYILQEQFLTSASNVSRILQQHWHFDTYVSMSAPSHEQTPWNCSPGATSDFCLKSQQNSSTLLPFTISCQHHCFNKPEEHILQEQFLTSDPNICSSTSLTFQQPCQPHYITKLHRTVRNWQPFQPSESAVIAEFFNNTDILTLMSVCQHHHMGKLHENVLQEQLLTFASKVSRTLQHYCHLQSHVSTIASTNLRNTFSRSNFWLLIQISAVQHHWHFNSHVSHITSLNFIELSETDNHSSLQSLQSLQNSSTTLTFWHLCQYVSTITWANSMKMFSRSNFWLLPQKSAELFNITAIYNLMSAPLLQQTWGTHSPGAISDFWSKYLQFNITDISTAMSATLHH